MSRNWRRVSAAGALSFVAALMVALLKPHVLLLGIGTALIGFLAMMTMAWGVRATSVSFSPMLSLVFSMAVPEQNGPALEIAGWSAAGSAAYFLWSLVSGAVLQWRYQTLALAESLRAAARLLHLRTEILMSTRIDAAGTTMRDWIVGETALAESLQSARDFIFAAPDSASTRRDTAILLRVVEMRDVLLASRLYLDLLGRDAIGQQMLQKIAGALKQIGDALDLDAVAVRDATQPALLRLPQFDVDCLFSSEAIAAAGSRARLLPALSDRLRNLASDVTQIHAVLQGEEEAAQFSRAQLQRFVAPEGWPLKTLRAQLSWYSPVLRHAIRFALAIVSACFIGLAPPWASHPHWLVLSVAVVLRGNLEQTLTRRNGRVFGTIFGCLMLVGLARSQSAALLGLTFLLSVGMAHAYVSRRYWLAATASTVMALLLSHMVNPAGGFGIGERAADTLLGAALAWVCSYVLPSWERRSLPRTIARALKALGDYAGDALLFEFPDIVEQRLARRRAYEALSTLSTALQRSAAEPKAVQVPVKELAMLLDHGQRLMAHLSMVRMTLTQRGDELGSPAAADALAATKKELAQYLNLHTSIDTTQETTDPEELSLLPIGKPAENVLPWLLRRLQVLTHEPAISTSRQQRLWRKRPFRPVVEVGARHASIVRADKRFVSIVKRRHGHDTVNILRRQNMG